MRPRRRGHTPHAYPHDAHRSGCGTSGARERGGRAEPHAASTGLRGAPGAAPPTATTTMPPRAHARSTSRASATACSVASKPTRAPAGSCPDPSHSSNDGTPGSPLRRSVHSPDSSRAACKKYRPSVHSSARDAVTSAVPADPVNPLTHSRRLSQSATYSESCASCVGTSSASSPAAAISERTLASGFETTVTAVPAAVASTCTDSAD